MLSPRRAATCYYSRVNLHVESLTMFLLLLLLGRVPGIKAAARVPLLHRVGEVNRTRGGKREIDGPCMGEMKGVTSMSPDLR